MIEPHGTHMFYISPYKYYIKEGDMAYINKSNLTEWFGYCVLLKRVDDVSVIYIQWKHIFGFYTLLLVMLCIYDN